MTAVHPVNGLVFMQAFGSGRPQTEFSTFVEYRSTLAILPQLHRRRSTPSVGRHWLACAIGFTP